MTSKAFGLAQLGNAYADGSLSNRNKIINGAMVIDQRNAGAAVTPTADNTYTLDRWSIRNFGASGRFSVQQTTASVPLGFSHSAVLTVTTTDATNNNAYSFAHKVEGFNASDLGLGSTTAKSITVSFWVRSSLTGTYCVALRNNAATESYVAEYAVSQADTWEYKTVSLPTVASGTWEITNATSIILDFVLGSNTGRETTAGAWQSGNFISTANQTEWIATSGATFYLTGVQLEAGDTATPFEHRSYGQELALCQRYCVQMNNSEYLVVGTIDNSSVCETSVALPVEMRTAPTLTTSGTAGDYAIREANSAITCTSVPVVLGVGGKNIAGVRFAASAALTLGRAAYCYGNSGGFLRFEAEL